MAIIQGHAMQSSSRGFYPKTINGSLRFNDDDSAYLSWTPDSAGDNTKKWTFSCWVKRANLGTGQMLISAGTSSVNYINFQSDDTLKVRNSTIEYVTTQKFRDPSAWYHIVFVWDTAQSVEVDRAKFYVNGELVTSYSTYTKAALNETSVINTAIKHNIGNYAFNNTNYLDGYLAEVFFIDGTAHAPTDFAETKNGVWVPKNITATDFTMGTNGFHLTFEDDAEVEAFNTLVWRGTGSELAVTGAGFSPDLVWVKERDNSNNHSIYDTVRGRQVRLMSNSTSTESVQTNKVDSFDADGFTTLDATETNRSGGSMVAWCWDAGANNTITGHSSVTYTGNGGTQTISGFPFSPDLVWIKSRAGAAHNPEIYDTVRGPEKGLMPSTTNIEFTRGVTSFLPDGFDLNTYSQFTNQSGVTFVAWGWDAGDSDPVSNTDGSITSTVKASQTNGFSIVQYEGTGASATIGHGLSSAPDFIISKNIDASNSWACYHVSTGADIQLLLNSTNGTSADTNGFSDVPTSTVINVGSGAQMDTNKTGTHIAYCWHDVTGKQKFGSYTGGTDGQKITTGFRPGFLLIKRTSSSGDGWAMFDSTRSPFNDGSTEYVFANSSATETSASNRGVNFVSDGFELVGTDGFINQSGTYIYAAFAGSYSDYITDVNTDGTVDSRVKASDTTGFSIVSWQGDGTTNGTFGHGLSSAPDMIVAKDRDSNSVNNNWHIWHTGLSGATYNFGSFGSANEGDVSTATSYGGIGDPSATTIKAVSGTVDSRTMNESGDKYIAYCWTETTGVSKFGTYTGNGTTNAITTGFKPNLVMIKRKEGTRHWYMFDDTRFVPQPMTTALFPGLNNGDTTDSSYSITFTDTGFTLNSNNLGVNTSGGNFVYAAFADTRDAAFWLDQSSNDNDWQPVNLDHNDTLLDGPTDNFVTMNPLHGTHGCTLSDGNLRVVNPDNKSVGSTIAPTSGQWYAEVTINSANYASVGVCRDDEVFGTNLNASGEAWMYSYVGTVYKKGTSDTTPASFTTGDVISICLDLDNQKLYFLKNGSGITTSEGTHVVGTTGISIDAGYGYYFCTTSNGNNADCTWNFGQQPFKYTPPA